MPLASLSKMMTFLLAIEAVDKNQVKETDGENRQVYSFSRRFYL